MPFCKLINGSKLWRIDLGIVAVLVFFASSGGCERPATPAKPAAKQHTKATPVQAKLLTGQELYARHCAACHGDRGDGRGIAATFLFPKPRDFQAGRFRLISTSNSVPSREDLAAALERGMPGSAMPPWRHLSKPEIQLLVDEVIRLRREGLRTILVNRYKEQDEEVDEEELLATMQRRTTPDAAADVPEIGLPTSEAIARGKEVYVKQSCHSCHGLHGKGDGQQKMIDDEGLVTAPRDFTRGIFKGGSDGTSLYRRIALGMPGTPMPSSSKNLTRDQMVDLVHFTLSLSDEPTRAAASLERGRLIVPRVKSLPAETDERTWTASKPLRVRVVPLWWRNDSDPGLEVQAVHDNNSIAVRLAWSDTTEDRHSLQTQSFDDAIALELYRGDAEPFLGMGNSQSPVDVWLWNADRQDPLLAVDEAYPRTVVDIYPFSEQVVATAEFGRPGTKLENQPEISLPAVAVGNQIAPRAGNPVGTSLAAGGPGSLTFRVPKSQLVKSHGAWHGSRWSVVMTRQLRVTSHGEGVSLATGDRASIAFAIWDGAHRDRGPQKLISIWQDLVLEK